MKVEIKRTVEVPLDALIKEHNMSNRRLAAKACLHPGTINALRTGKTVATLETARRILKALGVSEDLIK